MEHQPKDRDYRNCQECSLNHLCGFVAPRCVQGGVDYLVQECDKDHYCYYGHGIISEVLYYCKNVLGHMASPRMGAYVIWLTIVLSIFNVNHAIQGPLPVRVEVSK